MIYTVEPRYISALIGWRFAVLENGKMVHHYATHSEANQVKESLEQNNQQETFTPSTAIREGFRADHCRRVLEARNYSA